MLVTVRFFGNIDENQIPLLYEKIKEKIQEIQIRPFKVIPEKIGMFPNQNGKLIAAYIQKNEMLINLFHLFHEIEVSNAHQDKKMFLPHITLFRAKNDYKMNIEDIKLNNFSLPINKFIIYESQLINHERRYIPLFSIPIIE